MIDIFKQMLEVALFSSIVILLTLSIRAIVGSKLNINILSFLWIMVLLRLILPVTIDSPVHYDDLIKKEIVQPEVVSEQTALEPKAQEGSGLVALNDNSDTVVDFGNQNQHIAIDQSQFKDTKNQPIIQGVFNKIDMWQLGFYAWIMGIVCLLLFQAYKIIDFNRKLKTRRFIADKKLYKSLYESKRLLKIKRNFYLFECDYIDSPVTCGLFFPKVLLPGGLKGKVSDEKLNLIIMHELCHIKNNDILKNYLWMIATIVYWFNPLVYIGYRAYLEDIETVSDEMVLRSLDKKSKLLYTQSLIDVLRLSNLNFSSPIALSFCKSKTKLRRRVENMLKPKKKSKIFTVITVMLIVVVMLGCFTTACQPSDEEKTVAALSDNAKIDDLADQSDAGKEIIQSDSEEADEVVQFYETPASYQNYFEEENVKLTVDAVINGPEDNKITSFILEDKETKQADLDSFLNYFVGDAPLYEKKYYEQTKEEIKEEITYWENCILNCETNWEDVRLSDPYAEHDYSEDAVDEFNSFIDKLEKEMKGAPDKNEYIPISRELKAREDSDSKRLVGFAQVKEGNFFGMPYIVATAATNSMGLQIGSMHYQNIGDYARCDLSMQEIEENTGLTLESAISQVEEAAKHFGIDEIHLDHCSISGQIRNGAVRPILSLTFSHSINNIGMPYLRDATQLAFDDGEMSPAPRTETLRANVDESGIVDFSINSRKEIASIIDDNVAIMEFDRVIKTFEDEIINTLYMDGDQKREIYITKIELSYMPTWDDNGQIVALPVWDFRGHFYDPDNEVWMNSASIRTKHDGHSFLTVNAVDGSIISRHLGK